MFTFKILTKEKKSKARVGEFTTPHGNLLTPEFSFVATEGELKAIPKKILKTLPVNLIIVNTFHIFTKKILTHIEKSGGIHTYANFPRAIESDSGGFQVFSLGFGKVHRVGKLAKFFQGIPTETDDVSNPLQINEKGVTFTFDNKKWGLTPEKSMHIQQRIGADIIFAFDECTSPLNSKSYTKKAMERTHRWLKRCLVATGARISGTPTARSQTTQALFGIIQGGHYEDLRKKSGKFVGKQDVPGFGIGGSLGRTKEDLWNILEWAIPYLPEEKPRHLLGIGQVRDLFESVERGVDMFDCVIPTREARHKVLYTNYGRVNLRKMRNSKKIIDKNCTCQTCKEKITFTQLYELFFNKDPRAFYFSTIHNIQFFSDLTKKIRLAIETSRFLDLKEKYLKYY